MQAGDPTTCVFCRQSLFGDERMTVETASGRYHLECGLELLRTTRKLLERCTHEPAHTSPWECSTYVRTDLPL